MAGSNETSLIVAGSLRRAWRNAGTPANGTSGTYAGIAEIGDMLIDTTNKRLFQNTGTQASPTWAQVVTCGDITTKSASAYLTIAESGMVIASADGIYLYLPTYVSNAGLYYLIKATDTFSAGVKIYTLAAQSTALDGAAVKTSGAKYDMLEVICDGSNWNIVGKIGTWS